MKHTKKLDFPINSSRLEQSLKRAFETNNHIHATMLDAVKRAAVSLNIAIEVAPFPAMTQFRITGPGCGDDCVFRSYGDAIQELLMFEAVEKELRRIKPEVEGIVTESDWEDYCVDHAEEIASELGYKILEVKK